MSIIHKKQKINENPNNSKEEKENLISLIRYKVFLKHLLFK